MKLKYGRCHPCKVVYEWSGRPRLRDSLCPKCHQPLSQTCIGLLKARHKILEQSPLEVVR